MKDNKKTVNVPLRLLEELWDKLTDDTYDRGFNGDSWQSDELAKLVEELESILKENNSKILSNEKIRSKWR